MAKVRSSARKSGNRSVEVGVDDADQRDVGKVVTLGDHLRADQHLAAGSGEALEHARQARVRRGDVGVEPQQLDAGQQAGHLALESLGAVAEAGELGALQAGHTPGAGSLVVADAAAQAVAAREVGQGDVAVRAVPGVPAVAAGQQRRVAAAVQEEDRPCRRPRPPASGAARAAADSRPGSVAQVDDLEAPAASEPSTRRAGRRGAAARGEGLDARRGRAQHQRGAGAARRASGHGAGVVARRRSLACTRSRAPRRRRSGRGRAAARRPPSARRARAGARPAAAAPPGRQPLAGRQSPSAAPRRRRAESAPRRRPTVCGGQADLGHQDEHAAAAAQHAPRRRAGRPRSCRCR